MTDIELIQEIKEKLSSEAFTTLAKRHEGLFFKILGKYSLKLHNSGKNKEEIIDNKHFLLYKSVLSFKIERGVKFATYFGNSVSYAILNYCKSKKKTPNKFEELSEELEAPVKFDEEKIFNLVKNCPNKISRKILILKYFSDANWSTISKKTKLDFKKMKAYHRKGLEYLKNKL